MIQIAIWLLLSYESVQGVSDLAQEVNVEDFLMVMSYFQPTDTRVVEEQVQVHQKKEKKNLKFLFHVYDSENNTWRLSKCDWEASLQKPSHWEIFYSLQCRGRHDGSARICRWARICLWQTEPDEVLEGITVKNSLNFWLGVDCKTNMHVCFLNMKTIILCNGAASLGDLE